MKVKPLLTDIRDFDFVDKYLEACGVKDVRRWLRHDRRNLDRPFDYPNMNEAVEAVRSAIQMRMDIGILCDQDCDGICSSAIIYLYLTKQLKVPPDNITMFFHEGKSHGLSVNQDENIVQQVIDSGVNLLIIPDASSNDADGANELYRYGINTLVLDHHNVDTEALERSKAIVVNPHLGQGLNTALSGAGVTHKFCEAYSLAFNTPTPMYYDFVAVSLISDVCDLTTLENSTYLYKGLSQLAHSTYGSKQLKALSETFNRNITPIGLAFGMIPPINALCRMPGTDDKRKFFMALVGQEEIYEGIKIIKEARKYQQKLVKDMVAAIEPELDTTHKVNVGFADNEHKAYVGLIANKFCGATNKPTILLRPESTTTWSGSVRSPFPIASLVNESGLADCQGHEEACGIFLKRSNLSKLIRWFDNLDIGAVEPDIEVAAELAPSQITLALCQACEDYKTIWCASQGSKIVEPKFYIKATVTNDMLMYCGKANNSIRFTIDGVDFWKFRCSEEQLEQFGMYKKFDIEMIVTLGVNEWEGQKNSKALIDRFEIVKHEEEIGNWEDEF